jgi:hypothetical protein
MPEASAVCCGCCCLAAVITTAILIPISIHSLDQLDAGLNYDSVTLHVEDAVYSSAGIYTLGPGHWFIRYPKTIKLLEFVASHGPECPDCYGHEILTARTSDGLPVSLSVSFQYRYDIARLRDLYLMYKQRVCGQHPRPGFELRGTLSRLIPVTHSFRN